MEVLFVWQCSGLLAGWPACRWRDNFIPRNTHTYTHTHTRSHTHTHTLTAPQQLSYNHRRLVVFSYFLEQSSFKKIKGRRPQIAFLFRFPSFIYLLTFEQELMTSFGFKVRSKSFRFNRGFLFFRPTLSTRLEQSNQSDKRLSSPARCWLYFHSAKHFFLFLSERIVAVGSLQWHKRGRCRWTRVYW